MTMPIAVVVVVFLRAERKICVREPTIPHSRRTVPRLIFEYAKPTTAAAIYRAVMERGQSAFLCASTREWSRTRTICSQLRFRCEAYVIRSIAVVRPRWTCVVAALLVRPGRKAPRGGCQAAGHHQQRRHSCKTRHRIRARRAKTDTRRTRLRTNAAGAGPMQNPHCRLVRTPGCCAPVSGPRRCSLLLLLS
jgi:hypothetical protein